MLRPFRHRLFLSVWTASLVSSVGSLIQVVGASWLMTLLAPSPDWVALVQAATFKGEFQTTFSGAIPFSLWVLIQFSKQPNGNILISTLGMRDFEQMEIETESSLPLDQTFDLVRRFGSYIIAKGPVVKDGETFGLT